jgi:lipopolysaccharide/colanic/teichoic acid biosynthesis glycosyltransferase
MIERIFDIILSGFALLCLLPIFLLTIIILRLTGEGEIFFLQKRIGLNGKVFFLIKFATMLKDSPNIGTKTITTKSDLRILPFGRILRKTKINELPQLLNIFMGQMSIIGPRPLTYQTFSHYHDHQKILIMKVKPGLSGLGSIIFRNEEEIMSGENASEGFYKTTIAPYKGEIEEWYVINKSIYIYFASIALTIWVVLFPKSKIIWKIFRNLPEPPKTLTKLLNYKKYK